MSSLTTQDGALKIQLSFVHHQLRFAGEQRKIGELITQVGAIQVSWARQKLTDKFANTSN